MNKENLKDFYSSFSGKVKVKLAYILEKANENGIVINAENLKCAGFRRCRGRVEQYTLDPSLPKLQVRESKKAGDILDIDINTYLLGRVLSDGEYISAVKASLLVKEEGGEIKTAGEVISLARKFENLFELNIQKTHLRLKKAAWESIKKSYCPKYEKSFVARIAMDEEAVKSIYPEITLISSINSRDNIYKINYNTDQEVLRSLLNLILLFREGDLILMFDDPVIEEKLNKAKERILNLKIKI
jgi:hypothetical protein